MITERKHTPDFSCALRTSSLLCTFLLFILFNVFGSKTTHAVSFRNSNVIIIHNTEISRSEKEALIILPGLRDVKKGRKYQNKYFNNVGYDLYIPYYIDKDSFDGTVKKFTQFYEDQKLGEYKKVHVFAYVLGSWVINIFINEHGLGNISTIVYDRSPLQERAPKVIVEKIPCIGKLLAGQVLKDFSLLSYPSIPKKGLKIGILVESKATPLIRHFRKTTINMGPIDWNNLNFNQDYDDLIFTRLNHDEMYYSFDEIGSDILHFIKNGVFTKEARREWFDWDPFEKYKTK